MVEALLQSITDDPVSRVLRVKHQRKQFMGTLHDMRESLDAGGLLFSFFSLGSPTQIHVTCKVGHLDLC